MEVIGGGQSDDEQLASHIPGFLRLVTQADIARIEAEIADIEMQQTQELLTLDAEIQLARARLDQSLIGLHVAGTLLEIAFKG